MTPLHWAVVKGNSNCIRQIVLAGADILARTIEGKTPQDMAIELKSTFAWNRGLSEAGFNNNGTKRTLPLGTGIKMKTFMFILTIISFGLAFQTLSSLPYYSSILIVLAQAYAAHHVITNTILDAKHQNPARPSEIITQSPYFSTIIVASFFWVGFAWIARVLPRQLTVPLFFFFFFFLEEALTNTLPRFVFFFEMLYSHRHPGPIITQLVLHPLQSDLRLQLRPLHHAGSRPHPTASESSGPQNCRSSLSLCQKEKKK
jgi:hypothetical protein